MLKPGPVKCRLLPYQMQTCLNVQEVTQKSGWGITSFNLPDVWRYCQGEGVVIGVLDTGCDVTHPDLINNLLPGINFVEPGTPPLDHNGHGTHCAGVLVAENNSIGMVGVCPRAKVVPIKVLNDKGNGNMSNVANGIRWAADNGVNLLTMSLGTPVKVLRVQQAIQYAHLKKTFVFCAAGNAGKTKEIFYPANYPETIAIGAIDESFHRANFSNTGFNLDFMAPGVDITSTVPTNWYATLSGTSMAAPFAVGCAALLMSAIKMGRVRMQINTVEDIRNIFRQYTCPITDQYLVEPKFFQGFGIIDPRKLLEAIRPQAKLY